MKKIKNCTLILATWLNKHWIFKSIIIFIPTVWSFFLSYYGVTFSLKNDNGISPLGTALSFSLFLIVLMTILLTEHKKRRDIIESQSKEAQWAISETLKQTNENLYANKRKMLTKYIKDLKYNNKSTSKPYLKTRNPEEQLAFLNNEILNNFKELSQHKIKDLFVSMAYTTDNVNWGWINNDNLNGCATLDELVRNSNSSFYKIYSNETDFVFHNSKQLAAENNEYYFDDKDKNYPKGGGSIICIGYSAGFNETTVGRIILSISSYKNKFVDSEDDGNDDGDDDNVKNFKENVRDFLSDYEEIIKFELLDLYINESYRDRLKRQKLSKRKLSSHENVKLIKK